MNRKDEIREELEEIAPFLAKMKKENPFEVPYGYFDKMQREVLEKTIGERSSQSPAPSWWDQLVASFAFLLRARMAMGLLGLVLAVWAVNFWRTKQQQPLPSVATAEAEWLEAADAYIAANIDDFDDEFLMELVFDKEGDTKKVIPEKKTEEDKMLDEILNELEDADLENML